MSGVAAFPIVGVGASAGGVEALEGFFQGMPDHPGLACVVVTHLSPERQSLLHEIVARYTGMTVHIAADGMPVEVDSVYVMPADAILSIQGRRLSITRPDKEHRERKPIDIFFSALAVDLGELSAGVVLSGGDGDGTLGIKAIKERGGLTLAQVHNGHGPQHPHMPESAISTGFIDFAVAAGEMGQRLVAFARGLDVLDGMASASRGADAQDGLHDTREAVCAILRAQVGHDFSGYKTKTFMRRVQRRMQIVGLATIDAYLDLLREDSREVAMLFRDLLINVTSFFRDAEAFEMLAAQVVPRLFEGRGAEDTVRVWVPGCATGEEVYSIAALLREHVDTLPEPPRVQVFATDIDEHALSVARAGRYPAQLTEGISDQRRDRFFIRDGGSYVVTREVRDLCIFSPHSVLRDPPFSRIDLVSCRNLLIYFGLMAQHQVIPVFHYALRPEGYLFLGMSENISQFADLFGAMDKRHRIFQKRSDGGLPSRLPRSLVGLRQGQAGGAAPARAAMGSGALRQAVEAQVLEQFAPPHVVVNRDGDVVFYSARTGTYLEAASGIPTRQVMAMARKGLRLDLRTALQEVVETGLSVTRGNIAIDGDGGRVQMIALTVTPITRADTQAEPLYLALFTDQGPSLSREDAALRGTAPSDGDAAHLERELRDARERLQSLIEEYETALEELKASNEELVSVNEELQSTNEELEASKEELQSVNEELHNVNADLSVKVHDLDRANTDLQNLFDSTDVATVFLDRDLVIRSFTPAVSRIFNVRPGDRGRPLTDLSTRLALPDLVADAAAVLARSEPVERQIQDGEGRITYLSRVGPYQDGNHRTQGVVLTFVDVSGLSRAEARQRVLVAELQHRTRNLLAVVQSIAQQTLGKGGSLDAFGQRLAALGRVQGLLSQDGEGEIDLVDVVDVELRAQATIPNERITVGGPHVGLKRDQVQTMALALHELATNALKYGALKPGGTGTLDVSWRIDGRTLVLEWLERGVAMPEVPGRRGYGRTLIEKALGYALRARTDFTLGPDGVSCRIELDMPP